MVKEGSQCDSQGGPASGVDRSVVISVVMSVVIRVPRAVLEITLPVCLDSGLSTLQTVIRQQLFE